MKYRRMGASGLQLSAVSVGGWITFGGSIPDKVARGIVQAAIDAGVNFIDLADVYAMGKAEEVCGKMLADFDRSKLVISSKLFWPMSDDVNDKGLGRKHVVQSVEATLRRLKTDYLDLYFCHREDPETPLEETARAMDDLVRQGKVLYWGTSCWSPRSLKKAHKLADQRNLDGPRVEQPMFNLLDRGIEKDVVPTAARLGMGLVVWSPLAGGILTGKYNEGVPKDSRATTTKWLDGRLTEETLGRVRRFCKIADELEVRPEQLALAWILRRPEITSVITGATDPEHVKRNVAAAELEIPAGKVAEIEALFPV